MCKNNLPFYEIWFQFLTTCQLFCGKEFKYSFWFSDTTFLKRLVAYTYVGNSVGKFPPKIVASTLGMYVRPIHQILAVYDLNFEFDIYYVQVP